MNSRNRSAPAFSLRPAAPPDEKFLLQLYAATRAIELARSGMDAAQADVFIRQQFQARQRHYQTTFPSATHEVIVVGPQDAGIVVIARTPGEIRLVNMELLPAYQGRGIGTALISRLCQEAEREKCPLLLSVHKTNPAAQRLYRRLGFKEEIPKQKTHLFMRWKHGTKTRCQPEH